MNRHRFSILVLALAFAFAAGACAKKKGPEGAAAGSGGSYGTASGAEGGAEGSGSAAGIAELAASMPIVYFDYNQSVIRSDSKEPLKRVAEALKAGSGVQLTIEGHCDERGSSEYNLALGERRAQAVRSYLRTLGVDGKKLSAISYGKERPADPGHTEEAWAKNRRAELIVVR